MSSDDRIKVTLVSMAYPHPSAGFWPGIERHVHEFALGLRDAGARVRVVTSRRNGGSPREVHEGIEIFRLPDSWPWLGRAGFVMNLHLRSFGARVARLDEVLGDSDVLESFVPLPDAPSLRRPGLGLYAFFAHRDLPERLAEYLHLPGLHAMERRWFTQVHAVFVASGESRRVLEEEYGVAPDRIEVLPLGVSRHFLAGGAAQPAESVEPPPSAARGLRLLHVGPLIRRKGLDVLIDALARLRGEGADATVVLAGRGPEGERLKAQASRLGIADAVEMKGFVADEKLPDLYRGCDLFVFPSHREGFGLVLVEAMASRLPVIASNAPPIPEVVGAAGILFRAGDAADLASAIRRAIADPELRVRMAAEGRRRVEDRFDWRRIADRTLAVYRRRQAA